MKLTRLRVFTLSAAVIAFIFAGVVFISAP